MTRFIGWFILSGILCIVLQHGPAAGGSAGGSSGHVWKQLVTEAGQLGLPVKFLKAVPPEFVTFEFDDLQAFAAEYHLGEHRMVLNRTLSFNAAGGTLRPLNRLTHAEMETLYHELFHAYMDFLDSRGGEPEALLSFAKWQQRCHYSAVLITPVLQRKTETEERFLSERESWEALNEAWAVFVGWAVWNQLESGHSEGKTIMKPGKARDAWLHRLQQAEREGKIRGYYEPENQEERAVTRKRFLAPASRVSREEVSRLMGEALGYPEDLIKQAAQVVSTTQVIPAQDDPPCQ
jgi:hypothetical protein